MATLKYTRDEKSKAFLAEVKVKAAPNQVSISSIGEDGSLQIVNKATREVDFSGWILSAGEKNFILPENTKLAAGGKVVLSGRITGFGVLSAKDARLLFPSGALASSFDEKKPATKTKKEKSNAKKGAEPEIKKEPLVSGSTNPDAEQLGTPPLGEIAGKELSASVISAMPDNKNPGLWYYLLGLILLAVGAVFSITFLGKHLVKKDTAVRDTAREFEFVE